MYRHLLRRYPPVLFNRQIREASALLSLGGDNFSLDYGIPWPFFAAFQYAHIHDVPTVIWGGSVGPFSSRPKLEVQYARELGEVSLILVRETLSQQYLSDIGIEDNVALIADPAFVLDVKEPVVQLPTTLQSFLKQDCLGVNLSPILAKYMGISYQDWLSHAAMMLKCLTGKVDLPIILIPHVMRPGNNDYLFMKNVLKEANLTNEADRVYIWNAQDRSSMEIKFVISRLFAFTGARTHATIASLSTCVPTFSIGYSAKSEGINKDIFGSLEWVQHISKMTPELFSEHVYSLVTSAASIREYLASVMPNYKKTAEDAGHKMRKVLK